MGDISRDKLKKWTDSLGLDMFGVAEAAAYRDVEPQWNPLSILPEAKSVVVFARSIPRSYFRGIEEGTLWMRVNRHLHPKYAYYLCRAFEDNGFLAVPCAPLARERWPDGAALEDKPAPNVTPDIRFAAQLAGLGETGHNGAFLTPQLGARQSLGMFFTEAGIKPDIPFPAGGVCPGSACLACSRGCPVNALSTKQESRVLGGQVVKTGVVNDQACRFCVNGAFPDTSCENAPPNRMAAACVRACIACLEDGGIIKTEYRNKFRRREPWGLDNFSG